VRQLANAQGTVTATYAYDSFGGLRQSADNDSSYKNEFQYKDEIADAGTGTIYLRARYYDPKTGRFISRDPVAGYTASPQSLNGYAYAMSNPVMRSDPTGMLPEGAWCLGGCITGSDGNQRVGDLQDARNNPSSGRNSVDAVEGPRGRVLADRPNCPWQTTDIEVGFRDFHLMFAFMEGVAVCINDSMMRGYLTADLYYCPQGPTTSDAACKATGSLGQWVCNNVGVPWFADNWAAGVMAIPCFGVWAIPRSGFYKIMINAAVAFGYLSSPSRWQMAVLPVPVPPF